MRILMTQRALAGWGGSEMFTIEVSTELSQRGHEVAVYSSKIGAPAKIVYPSGVVVKSRLRDLPWTPDIIHGQHHLQTAATLSYFTTTPAIYYCHGWVPWVEQVLLHPRVRKYVMMCEWMIPAVATEFGIEDSKILALPGFINMNRFSEVRVPPDRPSKAILFGNQKLDPKDLSRLEDACMSCGLSLDKVGSAFKNTRERPESFLTEYDVVFAAGRSAFEAMSCGCAVITLSPGQAGRLVQPDNFEEMRFSNFIPIYGRSSTVVGREWLAMELAEYSPERVQSVTERVRRESSLSEGVDRLEEIYEQARHDYQNDGVSDAREFAPYLERLATEVDAMWSRERPMKNKLKRREDEIGALKRELKASQPADKATSTLSRLVGAKFRNSRDA